MSIPQDDRHSTIREIRPRYRKVEFAVSVEIGSYGRVWTINGSGGADCFGKLELAYYKADKAIQNIVDLLAAA